MSSQPSNSSCDIVTYIGCVLVTAERTFSGQLWDIRKLENLRVGSLS